jgi:hypothetical protein
MGLWVNYASPDIAGPAIPSILLQPTVHRSFRTLQGYYADAAITGSGAGRMIEASNRAEGQPEAGCCCTSLSSK